MAPGGPTYRPHALSYPILLWLFLWDRLPINSSHNLGHFLTFLGPLRCAETDCLIDRKNAACSFIGVKVVELVVFFLNRMGKTLLLKLCQRKFGHKKTVYCRRRTMGSKELKTRPSTKVQDICKFSSCDLP